MASVRAEIVMAGLTLAATANSARADENDMLFGAINDFCARPRGTITETTKKAAQSPFRAETRCARAEDKTYRCGAYFAKLNGGATLTLSAKSPSAPASECLFVGYSDDLAGLLARMTTEFALSQPVETPLTYNGWKSSGGVTADGRTATVALNYSLQDNQKAGSFNLVIRR
ncbi:hypothetical protein [Terrarubrum flagellatum]|uniref:hypothetical protein n=1 Tax=Terrirubrum flagellatum TaxID=2895980 RepID=UPI003144EA24